MFRPLAPGTGRVDVHGEATAPQHRVRGPGQSGASRRRDAPRLGAPPRTVPHLDPDLDRQFRLQRSRRRRRGVQHDSGIRGPDRGSRTPNSTACRSACRFRHSPSWHRRWRQATCQRDLSSPCQHFLGFVDLRSLKYVALRAWACSPCVKPCLLIAARALAIGLQLHRDQSGRPGKDQIGEAPTGSVHESALQIAGMVDPPACGFRQLYQVTLQSAFALIGSRAPPRATQGQAPNHHPLIAVIAAPDTLSFCPTSRMQGRHSHGLPLGGRRVVRGSTALATGAMRLQLQHRTRAPRSRGARLSSSAMTLDRQDVMATTSPREARRLVMASARSWLVRLGKAETVVPVPDDMRPFPFHVSL